MIAGSIFVKVRYSNHQRDLNSTVFEAYCRSLAIHAFSFELIAVNPFVAFGYCSSECDRQTLAFWHLMSMPLTFESYKAAVIL